ncbi:MAG: Eco57I restriction-modification methylase domain-containing protein [Acidimicrobiales bacterium]
MLDTLAAAWSESNDGANIWADSSVTFLDPFTKSGVFLREIVERLTKGLADEIPDLQTRVNHILLNQVFGIGITQLTSLLARRSVYCSKSANGEHSVGKFVFENEDGNIWFESMQHTWVGGREITVVSGVNRKRVPKMVGGKCKFCGASQSTLDRGGELETHAYAFIHTDDIKARMAEILGGQMQFDVIIGNPPYQLNDGGGSGTSAAPIYNKFVDQAKALDPRFLSMVIPARWFSGGKGLDEFRDSMLNDNRIRVIEDFPDSSEVFPGVQIKGGVCYFLWDRDNRGDCRVTTHDKSETNAPVFRPLLEPGVDIFIRYNEALPILEKVLRTEIQSVGPDLSLPADRQFSRLVSTRRPFGEIENALKDKGKGDIRVFKVGGVAYARRSAVETGLEYLDSWKVFIPFLGSGSDAFPHSILGKPFLGEPGTATTETNLVIGPLASDQVAMNVIHYIATRFFRFLVLQRKPSQNATRKVYGFVPMQDFAKRWTDEMLYEKYGITDEEITFINKMIRPMDIADE